MLLSHSLYVQLVKYSMCCPADGKLRVLNQYWSRFALLQMFILVWLGFFFSPLSVERNFINTLFFPLSWILVIYKCSKLMVKQRIALLNWILMSCLFILFISCRRKQWILKHVYFCTRWSILGCWRPSQVASAQEKNLLFFMPMEESEYIVCYWW